MSDNYWNKRFGDEGVIWGNQPSKSAVEANSYFKEAGLQDILVPGAGYGRHTEYFDKQGYKVDGIEISNEAIKIARANNQNIEYYEGSVLDMPFSSKKYDAMYCFNVLHLFKSDDRDKFIKLCRDSLKRNSLAYFTVFSDKESSYGKGNESEPNTFESKKGRPIHYYDEQDLINQFDSFEVISTGLFDEVENHGDQGEHTHRLRYIVAKKTNNNKEATNNGYDDDSKNPSKTRWIR